MGLNHTPGVLCALLHHPDLSCAKTTLIGHDSSHSSASMEWKCCDRVRVNATQSCFIGLLNLSYISVLLSIDHIGASLLAWTEVSHPPDGDRDSWVYNIQARIALTAFYYAAHRQDLRLLMQMVNRHLAGLNAISLRTTYVGGPQCLA